MSKRIIADKSFDFAIRIVNLSKYLQNEKKEYVLSKQILRSGTSIGANVHESSEAQSIPDFISKLSIALKESSETEFWLNLLYKTEYIKEDEYKSLYADCNELTKILTSAIKTSKQKLK